MAFADVDKAHEAARKYGWTVDGPALASHSVIVSGVNTVTPWVLTDLQAGWLQPSTNQRKDTMPNPPPAPAIDAIDPWQGKPGAAPVQATVVGRNFTPEARVIFDGQPATGSAYISPTQVNYTLDLRPYSGSKDVPMQVADQGGTSPTVYFLVRP